MLGNAKLVMRGGFGIFYDIEDGALNLQFGGEAPFGSVTDITPATYGNVPAGVNPFADPYNAFGQSNPFPTGGKVGSTFPTSGPAISLRLCC